MPLDETLSGRMERRLPIIVVVRLASGVSATSDGERTFTDNISARGARLYSIRHWQPGDTVQVTPGNEDPAYGSVIYCQTLQDGRFVLGVKFQDRTVTWSALRKYDGLQIALPAR